MATGGGKNQVEKRIRAGIMLSPQKITHEEVKCFKNSPETKEKSNLTRKI
jgi:hypothetical protein